MKKLFLLLVIISPLQILAQRFQVVNHYGIDCIVHNVGAGETFYKISEKYFTRPSTLALVNNIDEQASIVGIANLFIPLTETNFYKLERKASAEFTFEKLIHKVKTNESVNTLKQEYFLSDAQLSLWNTSLNGSLTAGDEIVIGFIKLKKNNTEATPYFIKKEKIVYGNATEKKEAKKQLALIGEKEKGNRKKRKVQKENFQPDVILANRQVKNKTKSLKKKQTLTQTISKKEKEFIEENKITKRKIKKEKKRKKRFANSYAREKAAKEALVRERMKAKGLIVASMEDSKSSSNEDETSNAMASNTTRTIKSKALPIVKKEIKEKEESPFIEHKLQRLTLLKKTRGKASFFYSGTAGAKFYVLTNLAQKGGIIKISNPTNGHFILAEVINSLPMADYNKGVIVKMSDNSKLPLGIKTKYFTVKVHY